MNAKSDLIENLEQQLEDRKAANRKIKKERAELLELNEILEARCVKYETKLGINKDDDKHDGKLEEEKPEEENKEKLPNDEGMDFGGPEGEGDNQIKMDEIKVENKENAKEEDPN